MGQDQSQDKVRILDSDLKLDNIPDDATLAIIKAVQEWGESRGTIQKRGRERRSVYEQSFCHPFPRPRTE